MKKIIDTNIIIRFLVWDDKDQYNKSYEIFRQIENNEIEVFVTEWVILECIYVLEKIYEISKQEIVDNLKSILFLDNVINPDKLEIIEALSMVLYENIDFIDALIISKAKYNNLEVISYDKKVNKIIKKFNN